MADTSKQDDHYLRKEADDFFQRNFEGKTPPELRDSKKSILTQLDSIGRTYSRVLEYGCNYGDLLVYLKRHRGADVVVGVDASQQALAFSTSSYGSEIERFHGTIAANELNRDPDYRDYFDLVIVDDVFGWVSRETLFQSIANIDCVLKEGGDLYIRDYYPDRKMRNPNHHVKEGFVFSHKLPGSTARIFETTGIYEPVFQEVYIDKSIQSALYHSDYLFESRWIDIILRKSYSDYYQLKPKSLT